MADKAGRSIQYEVTIDDLVAFGVFHARTSPTVRAMQKRNMMIGLPIIFLATFLLGSVVPHRHFLEPLFLSTFTTAIMAGYFYYYFKRGYISALQKMGRKLYSEEKNPGILGAHVLEVDEQGFTDRTEFKESRYAWGALVRIESEPGYTYLFTGATTAFVIPHNTITDGDFPALLEQVRTHYRPEARLGA